MANDLGTELESIRGLSQSVISFNESPKDYIEKGTESSEKNGFIYRTENDLVRGGGGKSDFGFNFWGYSSESDESVKEQFDLSNVLGNYFYPPLVSTVDTFLNEVESSLDLGGDLKKSRIVYSSIPKGMFDFNKASKGLIRPVEYFVDEINELAPPDDVYSDVIYGVKYFFFKKDGKAMLCEPRQEGTTEMLQTFPNKLKKVLLPRLKIFVPATLDGDKVVSYMDKRLRFTSTEKKVYAYRKKLGGGLAPFVDLYINNAGYHGTTSEGRFLKALPALLVAKVLQTAGVRTRIWSGEFVKNNSNLFVAPTLVKEYGDPLDLTTVGVVVSDSRYFRGLGSNAIGGVFYNTKKYWNEIDNRVDLLTEYRWASSKPLNEEASSFAMKYIKNAFKVYEDKGLVKTSQTSKDLMIYLPSPFRGDERFIEFKDSQGNNVDISNIKVEVIRGEATYKYQGEILTPKPIEEKVDMVKQAFYRGIDYISLILTKNPRGVISGIKRRVFDESIKNGDSTVEADRQANLYLSSYLIGDVFKNVSYTVNNEDNPNKMQEIYMSSKEEIEQGKEKRKKLLGLINEQITDTNLKSTATI